MTFDSRGILRRSPLPLNLRSLARQNPVPDKALETSADGSTLETHTGDALF
jgi:hypothetical protein